MSLRFTNFDDMRNLMHDNDSLKMLFYLREFNPNVSIDDLVNNLNLEYDDIKNKLSKLVTFAIVKQNDSKFELSAEGRIFVNGLYHNLGEAAPKI